MSLGTNIYRLRTGRGLSQGDLADALQVSRQSISKWEVGGAVPDLDKLLALSDLFGVTLDELVRGEIAEETNAPGAASTAPAIQTAAADHKAEEAPAASGGSTAKTVLIVILVILGLLLLPTVFMNPSWWPGLLLLIMLGGLGYAIFQREDRGTTKNQFLKILLIVCVILLPVLGFVNALPDPPVYAKAGKLSELTLQENPRVCFTDLWMTPFDSIHYELENTSAALSMGFKPSDSRIEVKKDGKWYQLKAQPRPTVHGYIAIPIGDRQSSSLDYEPIYGKLSPSDYRLLVQFFSELNPSNTYWIAKEFTVQ